MKKYFSLIILLAINLHGFSQKHNTIKIKKERAPQLDSITAANLIVGTWVDTQDPMHTVSFTTVPYSDQSSTQYKFSELGIKSVLQSYHWEYFTKDSADTRFVDSTKVADSTVNRYSINGIYYTSQRPLGVFENDTSGTSVMLTVIFWGNGFDAKKYRRVLELNNTYFKASVCGSEVVLFKRKE